MSRKDEIFNRQRAARAAKVSMARSRFLLHDGIFPRHPEQPIDSDTFVMHMGRKLPMDIARLIDGFRRGFEPVRQIMATRASSRARRGLPPLEIWAFGDVNTSGVFTLDTGSEILDVSPINRFAYPGRPLRGYVFKLFQLKAYARMLHESFNRIPRIWRPPGKSWGYLQ